MTTIRNIIGEKRHKLSTNQNTNVSLELENKTKPLTEYDIIDIVNLQNVFDKEREKSKSYRFNGKLNLYTSNVLSTGATSNDWDPLFKGTPPVTPNNWVMQITFPSSMDVNYDITYLNPSTTLTTKAYRGLQYTSIDSTVINNTNKLTISGVQKHNLEAGDYIYLVSNEYQGFHGVQSLGINGDNLKTSITLTTISGNTNITPTTYPTFFRVVNVSKDDISFNNPFQLVSSQTTDISGNTGGGYTTVTVSTTHDLSINDFVDIRITPNEPLNGVWRVLNVIGNNKFVVKVDILASSQTINGYARRLDCTPSEYYVRNFEVLTSNDYETYKCAFSSNIYSDISDVTIGTANDSWMFQFNKDVNVGNLKDNRNGPISQLYYTIIKRSGKNTYPWNHVVAGWDFNSEYITTSNLLEFISKNNVNGIGSVEKSTPRSETLDQNGDLSITNGSKYIGEFVEFNCLELIERPVADIIHRFNTTLNPSGEGYYYKPFKLLQIRDYSTQIETAESIENTIDVPGNYVTYSDGSIAWKDLLTIGYFEDGVNGVDYPFTNGVHYFYFNHNLYVRRQIPNDVIDQNNENVITSINEEC